MHIQNAYNISYIIMNDQHKFLAWDTLKQINYGRQTSKMAGGTRCTSTSTQNLLKNPSQLI